MPTATIDEFELDIRLQEPEQLSAEKYPPPTIPLNCTTSKYCD
ncbi:hypothetical protein GCM10009745_57190 [Kribbella yunnanensis]|uniref:Uncharacterized protein n=1 Tax=Kribbella yunnanensis TaxID=190194 RepID=A0ABN2ID69_9ACTN